MTREEHCLSCNRARDLRYRRSWRQKPRKTVVGSTLWFIALIFGAGLCGLPTQPPFVLDSFASATWRKGITYDQSRTNVQIRGRAFKASHTATALQSLPTTFGATLTEHMKKRRVTNEAMAEVLDVSARTISGWRNAQVPSLQLRDITAICICLHLEPELSDDLIAKAGLRPTCTEEHTVYRILLRTMYPYEPAECNEILILAGFPPLFRVST